MASDSAARPKSNLFYQSRQRRPLIGEARGIYIWDVDGKRYLDGSSGAMVANIGHSNERVLAAMRQQMEKATFAYRLHFENEAAEKLARMTAERMPAGLNRVFFVSGGSEAVESAIKLARQYAVAVGETSRWKVISRFPSYHGSTLGALALTGMATMTGPFAPMMREMPKIPAPDLLSRPRRPAATTSAACAMRRCCAKRSRPRARKRARLHHGAGRRRIDRRARRAGLLLRPHPRDLRRVRHPADLRRGDDRSRTHRRVPRRRALGHHARHHRAVEGLCRRLRAARRDGGA